MPTVIFVSRALDGQTQPGTTPVAARFIPRAMAVPKTAGDELARGRFMRKQIAGETMFF
jgi:hypothetical protein